MSGYIGPKNKIVRRFSINLWGRSRDPLNIPKNKVVNRKKKSDYSIRLDEKQKLRYFYGGVREKQFKSYYKRARQRGGNIGSTFLQLLETRLDCVLYRLNFCSTIFFARQVVSHGHVLINGRRVNIASYLVKPGDKVAIGEKAKKIKEITNHLKKPERTLPSYLTLDQDNFSGIFERIPQRDEISYPFPINENFIVEFYSR